MRSARKALVHDGIASGRRKVPCAWRGRIGLARKGLRAGFLEREWRATASVRENAPFEWEFRAVLARKELRAQFLGQKWRATSSVRENSGRFGLFCPVELRTETLARHEAHIFLLGKPKSYTEAFSCHASVLLMPHRSFLSRPISRIDRSARAGWGCGQNQVLGFTAAGCMRELNRAKGNQIEQKGPNRAKRSRIRQGGAESGKVESNRAKWSRIGQRGPNRAKGGLNRAKP